MEINGSFSGLTSLGMGLRLELWFTTNQSARTQSMMEID